MKALEFKTSKGKFVLVDNNQNDKDVIEFLKSINYSSYVQRIKLSEITEEKASGIVFRIGHHSNNHLIPTAKELLYSLLESKGVHLFKNPYVSKINPLEYKEAEQKTFKNPYIFIL